MRRADSAAATAPASAEVYSSVAAIAARYPAGVNGAPPAGWFTARKNRSSSWFEPSITGTRLNRPLVKAAVIDRGRTFPSTTGVTSR